VDCECQSSGLEFAARRSSGFVQGAGSGRTARVANVAGLPPAWIGVGSIDLFVEEDMEYARRLVHAGVATELLVVPGAFHGFDLLVPDAEASQQFSASWKSALRKAFASGKAV
jgi:acetyl esterase/lipase